MRTLLMLISDSLKALSAAVAALKDAGGADV